MKRFTLGMVLLFAVSLIAAPLYAAGSFDLTIPLPLTGKHAKFGEIMQRSYEIAAEEINAKGGIKGKKLVLSFEDSSGKPEVARSIVEKLIDVKKQPLIVGEYTSSCAKAVAAVAEERKTPYLIVASADDEITKQHYHYVFRQNEDNDHYADALVSFLKSVVKPKSIAVLFESSAFGNSGANAMEKDASETLGAKVVLKEKFETGTIDFRPLLGKVRVAQPDVVYTVSYANEAQLLMKQAKELRVDAKLYAGGAAGFAGCHQVDFLLDQAQHRQRHAIRRRTIRHERGSSIRQPGFAHPQRPFHCFDMSRSGPVPVRGKNSDFAEFAHFPRQRQQTGGLYAIVIGY